MIPSFVKFKKKEAPDKTIKDPVTAPSDAKAYVAPAAVYAEKWKEYVQPVNTEKWKEYVQPVNTEKWKEYIQPVNTEKWKEYAQPVNTEKWKEYVQPVNTEKWKEYLANSANRVGETKFNISLPAVKDHNFLNVVDITAPSGVTMAVKLPFPINEKGLSKLADHIRKSGGNVEF